MRVCAHPNRSIPEISGLCYIKPGQKITWNWISTIPEMTKGPELPPNLLILNYLYLRCGLFNCYGMVYFFIRQRDVEHFLHRFHIVESQAGNIAFLDLGNVLAVFLGQDDLFD
jgi:hypothetical protein